MEPLRIKSAIDTPEVSFDPGTLRFCISGISHPENAKEFYTKLLVWLDEFFEKNQDKQAEPITLDLNFRYINSTSYKYLREVLRKLTVFHKKGFNIQIVWQYQVEDEDLLEEGQILLSLPDIKLNHQFISYE
ncbi:DUF1987 domain-containing protein [Williamwhitmania taraxaci]|uniref:SiaC family regulatory phosphoprotein domain-containing protein n=1 Tax=Williamwhitmania taraxaci TaxID=1640674 RepID=A0A1G6H264_9BACT|nr:DUF1987 domain-containing protein [Williamwhitmania taraxaci]SDB88359.1 protein of unknown function [Williamwhitmania taraxaci]